MEMNMLRAFWLAKRRPDLSREAYMDHYENNHVRLGEEAIRGEALSYVRHYLHAAQPEAPAPLCDCVTEITFPDRASYDRCMARLAADRDLSRRIVEDEKRFIDRTSTLHYIVENRSSDPAALGRAPA
jgi:EthD domain-containing protein